MKVIELHKDIISFCEQNADEAIVRKYSRYFKEGYNAYGLTVEKLNSMVTHIMSEKGISLKVVYDLCLLLVKGEKYEETSFAILLLTQFKKQFDIETFNQISKWFDAGINNWAHADALCGEILWELLRKNIIVMDDFNDWKTATNKFKRRAVPVSLIKPMKKDTKYSQYYKYLDSMMMDEVREVHQGIGWFLREIWKKNPVETEKFLLKWKNKSARLIFQYACEKMTAEKKILFRKEK